MSINWRTSGQTTFAAWDALLPANSEIKKRGESRACYDAAGDLSKLCLGMLKAESSFATHFNAVPASMNNPLNLRIRGKEPFQSFDSIAACVNEWKARITSATYAYKDTRTVAELVHIYAPSSDNNDEVAYVATVESVIKSLPDAFTLPVDHPPEVVPVETIVFGKVPRPDIEEMICAKAGPGHGYYEVAPRQIVGGCRHITDGNASIEWYHDFFSIGGERADDALVDYIIDRAGRIAMFNNPFGTRAPWANGGTDGLEGDGLKFYNTLGVAAVNSRLFSVEHIGTSPNPLTAPQLEASAQLWAWHFDQMHVPYSSYPVNPNVGIVTDIEHWEFATKPCPGAGVRAQTNQHQARVRAILKEHQVVTVVDPPTVPEPEPTPSIYPPGMTVQLARRLYGSLKVSWAAKPFAFDPERSECRAWLDRGKAQLKPGERYTKATWPKINDVVRRGDGSRLFTFSDGWTFAQGEREL